MFTIKRKNNQGLKNFLLFIHRGMKEKKRESEFQKGWRIQTIAYWVDKLYKIIYDGKFG